MKRPHQKNCLMTVGLAIAALWIAEGVAQARVGGTGYETFVIGNETVPTPGARAFHSRDETNLTGRCFEGAP